jgi:hypothetical protein
MTNEIANQWAPSVHGRHSPAKTVGKYKISIISNRLQTENPFSSVNNGEKSENRKCEEMEIKQDSGLDEQI